MDEGDEVGDGIGTLVGAGYGMDEGDEVGEGIGT